MASYQRWGYLVFFVLAVIFLSSLHALNYPMTTLLKPLPIYALLVTVALSPVPTYAKSLLLAALFLSSMGDIALTLPLSKQIEVGLFSFLLAHLCYITLYIHILKRENHVKPNQWIVALSTVLMLVYAGFLLHYLWPYLGAMTIAVVVYVVVLLAMALLAMRVHAYCGVGAVLFVISDSIIAIDEFVNHAQTYSFAIMLTYYLAQWLLVAGLLKSMWRQLPKKDCNYSASFTEKPYLADLERKHK